MPVCLLLRVHSTGPVSSIAPDACAQLVEHHPDLEPGQVRAEAVVHAVTEAEVRIRVAAEVEAERIGEHVLVAVRRRFPEHHLVAGVHGLAAQVEVTRRGATVVRGRVGPAHDLLDRARRRVGRPASRSVRHWSGNASSATTAPAIALRVVSAPAAHSSEKKNCNSWSVSSGGSSPSRCAWHTTESMSSAGMRALLGDERGAVLEHRRRRRPRPRRSSRTPRARP